MACQFDYPAAVIKPPVYTQSVPSSLY